MKSVHSFINEMGIGCESESSSDNEDQWLTDDDEEASDPDMLVTRHPYYQTPGFSGTNSTH